MPKPVLFASYVHFFWAGLSKHPQTGGLLPSQRFLVNAMIAPVPRDYPGRVAELGSGNGTLTRRLAARCPDAHILSCEINPLLARDTQEGLARAGMNGRVEVRAVAAQELLAQLCMRDGEKPGYIISGIPLGNLGKEAVLKFVQLVRSALPENGIFVQFQHFLVDRKQLRTAFRNFRTIPVLLNIPPAFVYYAQK